MPAATLLEVRLTSFKSFDRQVLPLAAITVLTGLNSSGKSNALDAIEVLSRLAGGEDLREALDGRTRQAGPVRGGSIGCAPHGTDEFELGCTVECDGEEFELDVRIQVLPELRIVSERLRGPGTMRTGTRQTTDLIEAAARNDATLWVKLFNGKRGRNPGDAYRDNRLITTLMARDTSSNDESHRSLGFAASAVVSALRGVFHMDPIPHLMRSYVPRHDSELRRTGENLSAALDRTAQTDSQTFDRLVALIGAVGGDGITRVRTTGSELGDVMLALEERYGDGPVQITPAREMSDGLLRFTAIATALLTAHQGLDIDRDIDATPAGVLLVLEELENGLHPSQSGRVLQLLQDVSADLSTQVLFTSHSPALLNELTGELNTSVVVCHRTDTGHTEMTRMVELAGYPEAIASGRLGDLVSSGRMVRPEHREVDFHSLDHILGEDL